MKVILLQNIAKLGAAYDVKNVSPGHAQNFLIPKGLVEFATPEAIAALEEKKRALAEKVKGEIEVVAKAFETLGDEGIEITEKANAKGHLFKGISAEDIAKAFAAKTHTELNAAYIQLAEPLKEVGEHSIAVKMGESEYSIKLTIVAS